MSGVYIIAEAGVNHNGSSALAIELIEAAADAGADAVKFQTFQAANLVTRSAPKAGYQQQNTSTVESQLEMLRKLELSEEIHEQLAEHCRKLTIGFLSSAFDHESLHFLTKKMHLTTLKVPSGELTNAPLLLAHAHAARKLIISTGMATMKEIETALGIIAFGFYGGRGTPNSKSFTLAWKKHRENDDFRKRVTLLHCTTEYPAPLCGVNLKAMATMHDYFGLPVGYSDHTQGTTIPIAAAALGATVIEKHFTLDRTMLGPDHRASLQPEELKSMIQAIREVESALGDGTKAPSPIEIRNSGIVRKSLVALRPIKKNECFSPENLGVKRPGGGINPIEYWSYLGQQSSRTYAEDEVIQ